MNEKMNATLGNAFPKERIRYAMLSFFLAQVFVSLVGLAVFRT